MKKSLIVIAICAAAILCAAKATLAQNYPTKPIRIIVPFTPGGSSDIMGRLVAQKLTEGMGVQTVVENRPGAGGNIGVEMVARSPADGYTLVVGHIGTFGVNPTLYPKLSWDPIRDFAPVVLVAHVPNAFAVHPMLPAKTVKDVIALARAKPGQINYGSGGSGSASHLNVEYFKLLAKVDIAHIPYKGTAPMLVDLIAGQTSLTITGTTTMLPPYRSGRLRLIAVSSAKRLPVLPDLPTIAEAGVPGYEAVQWYGILAPAATPKDIIARLNAEIGKSLQRPDTKERLTGEGADPAGGTPEQFGALIKTEIVRWGDVIRKSGARPE